MYLPVPKNLLSCFSSRSENILHSEIAQYEEAEKCCMQLISEVRAFHFCHC